MKIALRCEKCRVLYMAYGSEYFKCRQAYTNRIFYYIQTVSKYYYSFQRYFDLEKQLEEIYYNKKYFKETYRGLETRAFKRVQRIINKKEQFDNARTNNLFKSLKRFQY